MQDALNKWVGQVNFEASFVTFSFMHLFHSNQMPPERRRRMAVCSLCTLQINYCISWFMSECPVNKQKKTFSTRRKLIGKNASPHEFQVGNFFFSFHTRVILTGGVEINLNGRNYTAVCSVITIDWRSHVYRWRGREREETMRAWRTHFSRSSELRHSSLIN